MAENTTRHSENREFEKRRWAYQDQPLEFWHKAALAEITDGPVLDLGCGDGLLLSLLRERGIQGIGFDISETGVAKARAKGLEVYQLDLLGKTPLPFSDHSFPAVTILEVLEHLYDPRSLLREAQRFIAKNGVLYVSVPNFNSLPARLQMLAGKVPENNYPGKGHVYWMNRSIIRNLLKETGFVVSNEKQLGIWQKKRLRSIGTALAKWFPNLFALSYFFKAKLKN